jgi:hypothetical protein
MHQILVRGYQIDEIEALVSGRATVTEWDGDLFHLDTLTEKVLILSFDSPEAPLIDHYGNLPEGSVVMCGHHHSLPFP